MPHALAATTRIAGLGLLVLLVACARQREPGYYTPSHDSTASDAMHRAQGGIDSMAPAQLQFGFGAQKGKAPAAAATPADQAAGATATTATAAAATTRGTPPAVLAETRTYLGTVPCPAGTTCQAMRMTLTLAPDGQWRARNAPPGGGAAQTAMGCWFLTGSDPTRIVLQSGDQSYAIMEFLQTNVLRVSRLNGQAPLLDSRLTRQADIDPISELSAKPAQACPAR